MTVLAIEERDPRSGRVLRTTMPIAPIQGFTRLGGARLLATARAGWLLDSTGRVYRVPEGGEPRVVGLGYQSLATDGESVWGLTTSGRVLRRIEPDTGRELCEISGLAASTAPTNVAPLAVGPTRVWTSNTTDPDRAVLFGAAVTSCAKPSFELSAAQLRINQRISQAAVRRVNALAARLDGRSLPASTPREGAGRIVLSVSQLRINQRISQAAVRRVNALEARFEGTGVLPPAGSGDHGRITLSTSQLVINQRISQAAVRRVSALEARIAAREIL